MKTQTNRYVSFYTSWSGFNIRTLISFVPYRYNSNGEAELVPEVITYREYGDEEWANSAGLEMYKTSRIGGQVYWSYNAKNLSREAKRIGISRFMQGEPKMEATITMSGYVFSGNNPVMFTDMLGDQYNYMDRNGNKWHHADIFAGTALEGTTYKEGWGADGFGNDTWGGGSGSSGGKGGRNSNQGDYTTQWEEIIEGLNSGKGDSWSPCYGFFDGGLYPVDANWLRLNEVVVMANQEATKSIPYYFSKSAYLYAEGVGYRGWFGIKGYVDFTKSNDGRYKVGVSMSAYSPTNPGTPNGIGGSPVVLYGNLRIQSIDGRILREKNVSPEYTIYPSIHPADERSYFNYQSLEFSSVPCDKLKVFFFHYIRLLGTIRGRYAIKQYFHLQWTSLPKGNTFYSLTHNNFNSMKFLLIILISFVVLHSCSPTINRKSEYYISKATDLMKKIHAEGNSSAPAKYNLILSYIDSAIYINPNNVDAYTLKVSILQIMGNDTLSLRTLRQVMNMRNDFPETYILMGTIFKRNQFEDSAKKYFYKAYQIYLTEPASDGRNLNLLMTCFMLSGNRDSTLSLLSVYPIHDSLTKEMLINSLGNVGK